VRHLCLGCTARYIFVTYPVQITCVICALVAELRSWCVSASYATGATVGLPTVTLSGLRSAYQGRRKGREVEEGEQQQGKVALPGGSVACSQLREAEQASLLVTCPLHICFFFCCIFAPERGRRAPGAAPSPRLAAWPFRVRYISVTTPSYLCTPSPSAWSFRIRSTSVTSLLHTCLQTLPPPHCSSSSPTTSSPYPRLPLPPLLLCLRRRVSVLVSSDTQRLKRLGQGP